MRRAQERHRFAMRSKERILTPEFWRGWQLEEVLAEEDPWREAWNTQVAVLIGASIDENFWAIDDFSALRWTPLSQSVWFCQSSCFSLWRPTRLLLPSSTIPMAEFPEFYLSFLFKICVFHVIIIANSTFHKVDVQNWWINFNLHDCGKKAKETGYQNSLL